MDKIRHNEGQFDFGSIGVITHFLGFPPNVLETSMDRDKAQEKAAILDNTPKHKAEICQLNSGGFYYCSSEKAGRSEVSHDLSY